ncbi:MAG: hypothetical protein KC609_07040, partial [Myxococcales bacterium]|nr:hypothetical protein [Myxococcales bacterium]
MTAPDAPQANVEIELGRGICSNQKNITLPEIRMTIARARAHEEALCTPRRAPLDPRREETIVALARRSIAIAAVVVALLVGCTTPTTPPLEQIQREVAICPEGPTLKGIDVSKWQGTIDWDKVAADGVIYAFIRVSDGFTLDGQFAFNWAEAKRVGVIRGVYQFFRPGKDAVDQANLLLDQMGPLGDDDLPPVLDVEAIDGQGPEVIVAKIHQWVSTIETALGRRPIIYSGRYFWNDNVGTTDFSSYPLWIPAYGPTCPTLPNAWSEWVFFQFSSTGAVKGIVGNVDMNQFNGDHDALLGFIASTQIACGNGICEGGETPTNCPSDCPLCEPIPPAGRVVDESEICFEKGGDPQYWRDVQEGYGDGLLWTKTTSNANPANFAIWHLDFELGGEYRIEAYLKAPWAESKQAAYQIRHNGQTETVVVDTSTADGWLEIGTFVFAVGADQWVRVDDNTGEPSSSDTMLVADALRVTNLNPPPDTSEPDTSEPDTRDDTNAPETVTPEIDVGNPTVDAGDPDGTIGQDTSGNGNKSAGCQLLAGDAPTTGSSSAMIGLLLGLVAFWCRRRRIRLGRIAALLLGIIAISALLPTTAWANDGSFGGKGAALLPLKQTAIRMLSEEIVIEQREEPPRNKKRSGRLAFWVTARYRFENPTNRPVA